MVFRDTIVTLKCQTNCRLDGKVAIVTGATSGAGLEIAKDFANRGARVVIASRNLEKLENARKDIINYAGNTNVVAKQMDFVSLKTVRSFVKDITATEPRVDILVNNIGASGLGDRLSEDGLHVMMQVNYFATFLLTFLLFPLLRASAPSRIINVTSLTVFVATVDVDHLNDLGKYPDLGYYSNAKLADVYFTIEMDKRIRRSGVSVFSVDPGVIGSDFFRNYNNSFVKDLLNTGLKLIGRPPNIAAKPTIFLALDPNVEGSSGKHFRDCGEFFTEWFERNPALTNILWEKTKQLVKITPEEDWELNRYITNMNFP